VVLGSSVAVSAIADTNGKASPANAAAAKLAAAKEAAKKEAATLTVKEEPLKIEVTLKGIFEASDSTAVRLSPEAWPEWTVLNAVEQGKRVSAGETLVEIDTRKIDLAITDMEAAEAASDLARKLADESFRLSKKSVPLQLQAAKLAAETAQQNLDTFMERDKEEAIKDAHYTVEQNENFFLYEQEELRQLEKMYKEDDVTEETEEIILLRLQHRIKSAKLRLAKAKQFRDDMLKFRIPRQEIDVKTAAETAAIALEAAKAKLPASLVEKRMALEKMDRDRSKAADKLARTRRDRAAMTILSPADGLVYYGHSERGQWPGMATVARMLKAGNALKPNMTVMTIVNPDSMFVRVSVEEKYLHQLDTGAKATVTPAGFPEKKLSAELAEVSIVPISTGKFDGKVSLAAGTDAGRIVPGMVCSVKFTAYENPKAMLVPKSAVHDEDGKFVYVQVDGKPEKREVKTGKSQGDKVEVTAGLSAGDVVLLKKPAA